MGVCNIVLTVRHARHRIVKGEKLIWGEWRGRSSGLSELEIEMSGTFLVEYISCLIVEILTLYLVSACPFFCVVKQFAVKCRV